MLESWAPGDFMRLPNWIETLFFAGLRPDARVKLPLHVRFGEWLDRKLERIATPSPADPAIPSGAGAPGRSKLKWAALVGTPLAVTLSLVLLVASGRLHPPRYYRAVAPADRPLGKDTTATESLNAVSAAHELEVLELSMDRASQPAAIVGKLRNNADRLLGAAELSFNVTDEEGMLLGFVATTVRDVPAHGTVPFRVPVPQKDAGMALVRDTRRIE